MSTNCMLTAGLIGAFVQQFLDARSVLADMQAILQNGPKTGYEHTVFKRPALTVRAVKARMRA